MELEIPLRAVETTDLDRALAAAEQNENLNQQYYDLFLNTEIFIPLVERPDTSVEPIAIKPLLMEVAGELRLMLFDTEERLYAWGSPDMEFAAMPGYETVEMMSAEFPWILNAGTEHPKEFNREEIQWLKQSMEEVGVTQPS